MKDKYTGVQYLIEHIKMDHTQRPFTELQWKGIFEIALNLDKVRIINAFYDGSKHEPSWEQAEHYFNSLYNK